MDLTLLQEKDTFLRFVKDKLATVPVDYKEKNLQIEKSSQNGSRNLKAGVVLLLNFKTIQGKSEYVFQLIKRSEKSISIGRYQLPRRNAATKAGLHFKLFSENGNTSRHAEPNANHIQQEDKEYFLIRPVFIHRLERSMGRSRFKSF